MGGKAKPTKHTSKELQAKADLHKPRGGGKAGQAERAPLVAYICTICRQNIASTHALKVHYEAKHPKEALDESAYEAQMEKAKAAHLAKPVKPTFTAKNGPSTL